MTEGDDKVGLEALKENKESEGDGVMELGV